MFFLAIGVAASLFIHLEPPSLHPACCGCVSKFGAASIKRLELEATNFHTMLYNFLEMSRYSILELGTMLRTLTSPDNGSLTTANTNSCFPACETRSYLKFTSMVSHRPRRIPEGGIGIRKYLVIAWSTRWKALTTQYNPARLRINGETTHWRGWLLRHQVGLWGSCRYQWWCFFSTLLGRRWCLQECWKFCGIFVRFDESSRARWRTSWLL